MRRLNSQNLVHSIDNIVWWHSHFPIELSRQEAILDKPIPHPSGKFTLHISKSNIDHPEAGFGRLSLFAQIRLKLKTCAFPGVHVKGHIIPGTVLAIYAGTVHFPHTLKENIVKGNSYMYGRYDGEFNLSFLSITVLSFIGVRVGVVVDGRDWERRAFAARRLLSRLQVQATS